MSRQGLPMASKTGSVASTIIACVLAWLFIVLVAVLAIQELRAPEPERATAPAGQFSAERAMVYVRAIASAPHPLGSDANNTVRNYLLAQLSSLGLNPQVFDGTGTTQFRNSAVIAHTRDILGRLSGSANTGAIMLLCHYDSVPTAPAAADDGAAVAAILEAVRAARAGPGLKNDLIILFTDGEESGLLGADAFAASHPWMKDVALVLNFEARGNRGPSMLFETSPGNATLIEAVAHNAPRPVGSSLFYSLYKLLPNNTDFTVFRQYKIPGLNFAFGENLEAYHSRLDSADNLSLGSLQHHGSYALSLVLHFGQMDLSSLKKQTGDDVFFDWLGGSMITYSERWVLPGEVLATLLLVLLIVFNLRRSKVRPARLMLAFGASLAIMLAVPVVLAVTQWLLSQLLADHIIASDARANSYLLTGHILLGFCTAGLLLAGFRKRLSVLELSLSGLILVVLLTWLLALALPASSYLLFWPSLLAMLGPLLITFVGRLTQSAAQQFGALPAAAVTILLFAPLIYLLYVFLTLQLLITAAAIGILVGVFFIVALPFMDAAIPAGRSPLVLSLLLVGALVTFSIGGRLSRYTSQHPRRDTVLYSLNADSHSAEWISYDDFPDSWTTRVFGSEKPQSRPMPDYLAGAQWPVLSMPASALDLLPPVAVVKADEKDGDVRKLRLSVRSQRNANVLRLGFSKDVEVVSIRSGGREISSAPNSLIVNISLLGMDANGTDLELTAKAVGKISFWLADQSYGLPAGVPPRPEEDAASIYAPTDQIWVCRKYSLGMEEAKN